MRQQFCDLGAAVLFYSNLKFFITDDNYKDLNVDIFFTNLGQKRENINNRLSSIPTSDDIKVSLFVLFFREFYGKLKNN